MSKSELAWRSLHDLGLATWFGGSVFETVALPRPEDVVPDGHGATDAAGTHDGDATKKQRRTELAARLAVSEAEAKAMQRWSPVLGGAMVAHLAGGLGLVLWNRSRIAHQKGVATSTVVKGALTVAATGLTVLAGIDGLKARTLREQRAADPDDPVVLEQEARVQRRMRAIGTALPLLTGGIVVMSALHGEQQRPREMARGILAGVADRIPLVDRIPVLDSV